ncbi:MAG: peptidase MA family metallohydrolase [Planctomycetota bacterium]
MVRSAVCGVERRERKAWRRRLLWCLAAMAAMASAPARGREAGRFHFSRGEHAPYEVTTRHFELEFSVPPAVGRKYAALCERAYAKFRQKFHVPADAVVWEGKCQVTLFARHSEFVTFARNVHHSPKAAESGGYTRITKANPDVVLYLKGEDHVKLQQVLVHEMTHVFLQLFHKQAKIETWLHEGFAQYFEFRVHPGRSRLVASRRRAKRLVERGEAKPLRAFWTAGFPATDHDSYAQAWSLIDFMVTKGGAKRTGDFILRIKDGESQESALVATFGCPLDKFEALWKRYVAQTY